MTGAAFCGSTLLAFLLNAHPSCVSVGELTGPLKGAELDKYPCSCGRPFIACDFFLRVAERMAELGQPFDPYTVPWTTRFRASEMHWLDVLLARSLLSDRLNRWRNRSLKILPPVDRRIAAQMAHAGAQTWAFARASLDLTGKSVFVDSSKDHQRPRRLFRAPGIDLRVIHLVKDVRSGAASFMKHFGIRDAARATRLWRRANIEADRTLQQLPRERWRRIRYQDLCADPQGVLDSIADFLGVERTPVPTDYRAQEHHIIGNEMRLGGNGQIRQDESWKARLSAADIDVIARIGGRANRHLGFDWPPAR